MEMTHVLDKTDQCKPSKRLQQDIEEKGRGSDNPPTTKAPATIIFCDAATCKFHI